MKVKVYEGKHLRSDFQVAGKDASELAGKLKKQIDEVISKNVRKKG